MMSKQRVSPRNAIRSWLNQTHTALMSDKETPIRYDKPSLTAPRREGYAARGQRREKEGTESIHSGTNLARRLGLHAPFSTFPDADPVQDPHTTCRTRRKRRQASSDSLIEGFQYDEASRHCAAQDDSSLQLRAENHNELPMVSEASKKYERRKRHKTRADKYDLKAPNNRTLQQDPEREALADPPKRRTRRKWTVPNALVRDFAAANVAQGRLTVGSSPSKLKLSVNLIKQQMKSIPGGGVFGNGRASAPVRRQGGRFPLYKDVV